MSEQINYRYRYDYFIIWGNGLPYVDGILSILRGENSLEILSIERRKIKNMKEFVFGLYGCDPVPIEHLRGKLAYLFKVPAEIIIIFTKNLAPEETYFGEGEFRHIQCSNVKQIKEKMRNLYNPRIDGCRTEEHVIHASDYEEQVDYFLKMLGHPEGIRFLDGDGTFFPFKKPFYIPKPNSYTFKTIPIKDIRASIIDYIGKEGPSYKLVEISETPHFQTLHHNVSDYEDYYKRFRYDLLRSDHYLQKLIQMNMIFKSRIIYFDPIIVISTGSAYKILDGVHRAAVLLNNGFRTLKCVEFSYL